MPVIFNVADKPFVFKNKTHLKQWVSSCFKKEHQKLDTLNYIFCSDDYLLNINKQFLQHDYYTDIITFNLSELDSKVITGEVYISLDRVKDNAKALGLPVKQELLRVIIHGALHLCGYKDNKKQDQKVMRAKEEEYLNLF